METTKHFLSELPKLPNLSDLIYLPEINSVMLPPWIYFISIGVSVLLLSIVFIFYKRRKNKLQLSIEDPKGKLRKSEKEIKQTPTVWKRPTGLKSNNAESDTKPTQSKWKRPEPKDQEKSDTINGDTSIKPVQSKWKRPEPKIPEKSDAKPIQSKWKKPQPIIQDKSNRNTSTSTEKTEPAKLTIKVEEKKEVPIKTNKEHEKPAYPKYVPKTEEQEKEEMKQFQIELEEEEKRAEEIAKKFMRPVNLNIDPNARPLEDSKKNKEKEIDLVKKMCGEFREVSKLDEKGMEIREERKEEMKKVRSARNYFKIADRQRSESLNCVPRIKLRSDEELSDSYIRGNQKRLSQFEPGRINKKFTDIFETSCNEDTGPVRPPRRKIITLDQVLIKDSPDTDDKMKTRDAELNELKDLRRRWVQDDDRPIATVRPLREEISSLELESTPVNTRWNPVDNDRQMKTMSMEIPSKLDISEVFKNNESDKENTIEVDKELIELRESRPTPVRKRWNPRKLVKTDRPERSKSAHVLQRVKLPDDSWVVERSESKYVQERSRTMDELEQVKQERFKTLQMMEDEDIDRPSLRHQNETIRETRKEIEEVRRVRAYAVEEDDPRDLSKLIEKQSTDKGLEIGQNENTNGSSFEPKRSGEELLGIRSVRFNDHTNEEDVEDKEGLKQEANDDITDNGETLNNGTERERAVDMDIAVEDLISIVGEEDNLESIDPKTTNLFQETMESRFRGEMNIETIDSLDIALAIAVESLNEYNSSKVNEKDHLNIELLDQFDKTEDIFLKEENPSCAEITKIKKDNLSILLQNSDLNQGQSNDKTTNAELQLKESSVGSQISAEEEITLKINGDMSIVDNEILDKPTDKHYETLDICMDDDHEILDICKEEDYEILDKDINENIEILEKCTDKDNKILDECIEENDETLDKGIEEGVEMSEKCIEEDHKILHKCIEEDDGILDEGIGEGVEILEKCIEDHKILKEWIEENDEILDKDISKDIEIIEKSTEEDNNILDVCLDENYETLVKGIEGVEISEKCKEEDHKILHECTEEDDVILDEGIGEGVEILEKCIEDHKILKEWIEENDEILDKDINEGIKIVEKCTEEENKILDECIEENDETLDKGIEEGVEISETCIEEDHKILHECIEEDDEILDKDIKEGIEILEKCPEEGNKIFDECIEENYQTLDKDIEEGVEISEKCVEEDPKILHECIEEKDEILDKGIAEDVEILDKCLEEGDDANHIHKKESNSDLGLVTDLQTTGKQTKRNELQAELLEIQNIESEITGAKAEISLNFSKPEDTVTVIIDSYTESKSVNNVLQCNFEQGIENDKMASSHESELNSSFNTMKKQQNVAILKELDKIEEQVSENNEPIYAKITKKRNRNLTTFLNNSLVNQEKSNDQTTELDIRTRDLSAGSEIMSDNENTLTLTEEKDNIDDIRIVKDDTNLIQTEEIEPSSDLTYVKDPQITEIQSEENILQTKLLEIKAMESEDRKSKEVISVNVTKLETTDTDVILNGAESKLENIIVQSTKEPVIDNDKLLRCHESELNIFLNVTTENDIIISSDDYTTNASDNQLNTVYDNSVSTKVTSKLHTSGRPNSASPRIFSSINAVPKIKYISEDKQIEVFGQSIERSNSPFEPGRINSIFINKFEKREEGSNKQFECQPKKKLIDLEHILRKTPDGNQDKKEKESNENVGISKIRQSWPPVDVSDDTMDSAIIPNKLDIKHVYGNDEKSEDKDKLDIKQELLELRKNKSLVDQGHSMDSFEKENKDIVDRNPVKKGRVQNIGWLKQSSISDREAEKRQQTLNELEALKEARREIEGNDLEERKDDKARLQTLKELEELRNQRKTVQEEESIKKIKITIEQKNKNSTATNVKPKQIEKSNSSNMNKIEYKTPDGNQDKPEKQSNENVGISKIRQNWPPVDVSDDTMGSAIIPNKLDIKHIYANDDKSEDKDQLVERNPVKKGRVQDICWLKQASIGEREAEKRQQTMNELEALKEARREMEGNDLEGRKDDEARLQTLKELEELRNKRQTGQEEESIKKIKMNIEQKNKKSTATTMKPKPIEISNSNNMNKIDYKIEDVETPRSTKIMDDNMVVFKTQSSSFIENEELPIEEEEIQSEEESEGVLEVLSVGKISNNDDQLKKDRSVKTKLLKMKEQTGIEIQKIRTKSIKVKEKIVQERGRAEKVDTTEESSLRTKSISRLKEAGQKMKDLTNEQITKVKTSSSKKK